MLLHRYMTSTCVRYRLLRILHPPRIARLVILRKRFELSSGPAGTPMLNEMTAHPASSSTDGVQIFASGLQAGIDRLQAGRIELAEQGIEPQAVLQQVAARLQQG